MTIYYVDDAVQQRAIVIPSPSASLRINGAEGNVRLLLNTIRKYGREPFRVGLLHGGPGAAGEMKPVADKGCGHIPWRERYARETFYTVVREEIRSSMG
jgi:hypothetical protein